ncbi:MAG: hypothetical protein FWH05_08815 [Oscillospiraceae bacterium]|nr:hypothetical protein [Oscillospiraceae bacterium]
MRKTICIILGMVMILSILTSCGSAESQLVGTWGDEYVEITFFEDGTYTESRGRLGSGFVRTYSISGDKLRVGDELYDYTIRGGELRLTKDGNTGTLKKK